MCFNIISVIKNNLSTYIRILLGVVAVLLTHSRTLHGQVTSSAYNFLELPSSSHAYALGGTGIAVVDADVSLVDQNPALIGPEIGMQAAFGYMHYLGSSNFASVRYGMGAGEHSAWAVGFRYLNYGSMTGFDQNGVATGTFSPSDIVGEGSYCHDINERLRGGVNLKMIYSNYEQYTAFAMAVDVGINYYDEEKDLSLSAVIKNAGGQIKRFDSGYARLPFDLQFGYMQGLGSTPLQLSINAVQLTRWRIPYYQHDTTDPDKQQTLKSGFFNTLFRHLNFGLQYSPSEKFYIALGYNYKVRTDMASYQRSFLSGFSVGAGIRVKSFGVGVSYAQPHKHGASLMVNLNCDISELL